jgi:hypothetical protein
MPATSIHSPVRDVRKPGKTSLPGLASLAWSGWSLKIKEGWKPLKIEGEWKKGRMVIGSSSSVLFQIQWKRIPLGKLVGESWIADRLRSRRVTQEDLIKKPEHPIKSTQFHAWVPPGASRKNLEMGFYYLCDESSGLALEMAFRPEDPECSESFFMRYILPSLTIYTPMESALHAVFGCRFQIPPGYQLRQFRLNSGDIGLRFSNSAGDRLLAWQVYPARLALARRKLQDWLKYPPFRESRRVRIIKTSTDSSLSFYASGCKMLPFPLGFISRRHYHQLIQHDENQDRLTIIEMDGRKPVESTAFHKMRESLMGGAA